MIICAQHLATEVNKPQSDEKKITKIWILRSDRIPEDSKHQSHRRISRCCQQLGRSFWRDSDIAYSVTNTQQLNVTVHGHRKCIYRKRTVTFISSKTIHHVR